MGYSSWPCRAITHGMAHLIGQVAPGQFADLVLWKPENFGSKPEVVIKGGLIAWAQVRPFERLEALNRLTLYPRWATPMLPSLPSNQYTACPCGDPNPSLRRGRPLRSFRRFLSKTVPPRGMACKNGLSLCTGVGRSRRTI